MKEKIKEGTASEAADADEADEVKKTGSSVVTLEVGNKEAREFFCEKEALEAKIEQIREEKSRWGN